jgi:hypothetical protein
VFIADQALLGVSFSTAHARLAEWTRNGSLVTASRDAYDDGIAGLVQPEAPHSPVEVSLAEVRLRDLLLREGYALLALRWEAFGPGGVLFPALDADVTLTPSGQDITLLRLDGAYRMPPGPPGRLNEATAHGVATVTIRAFVSRMADAIGSGSGTAG